MKQNFGGLGIFYFGIVKNVINLRNRTMKKKRFKLTAGWTDVKTRIIVDENKIYTDSLFSQLKLLGQPSIWRKIKEEIFEKEGRKCWICGTKNVILQAHEFWKYYLRKRIKKLVAIHHLCLKCHGIQHFDRTSLFEEDANWRKWILKLCKIKIPKKIKNFIFSPFCPEDIITWEDASRKIKIPKRLKEEIKKFLKNQRWKGEIGNVTEERIWDVKGYLAENCPEKERIGKEIKEIRQRLRMTEELINHFCKVNHCARKTFEKYWEKVKKRHLKIEKAGIFETDYGKYEKLLKSCRENHLVKKKLKYRAVK